jgi:hypothetical protein
MYFHYIDRETPWTNVHAHMKYSKSQFLCKLRRLSPWNLPKI